ncbi:polyketide synthase [Penicillium lividum]|nr:polyketide synthase [Penicillium lividum]
MTGNSSPIKAPTGTLIWKPDLAWLDEAKLQRYIVDHLVHGSTSEQELGAKITTVIDMAAHKNPNLVILQLGHSEVLIESILSILGSKYDKTIRCSSYTLFDPDTEKLAQSNDLIYK